jgi:hypothetical protein
MKKIVLVISAFLLLSNIATAQQDSTLINASKSGSGVMKQSDKKYSDSSGKYYPYGGDSTKINHRSKGLKSKNKRDKTDSVNPANPLNK